MEFGMFHEFPSLPGRTESEAFDEAMEQVDAGERLGLDVMWLAELHFEPRRSVLSAPLSIASAIAARTRRMKIGIAVQVLPLCHPLRLAEEAATVDQLSHGRLIFGVGRSGVAQTYEAYGVSYAESRDRFREILDIVEQAWTKPSFSYAGKYHFFKDVAVVPKPYQKTAPPIRIAASTPATFTAIGPRVRPTLDCGAAHQLVSPRRQIHLSRGLEEAAAIPAGVSGFVSGADLSGRDEECAQSEPKESIMHFYHEQANLLEGAARLVDPETAARRMRRVDQLRSLRYEDGLHNHALVGNPAAVAKKLLALQQEIGLSGILAELNCGGLIPHEQVLTAMQLLCEEVKPHFAA
jgi:alkanesulfonate monooxygenase SsuD/methylene tetrahydromethanopterin reductase-like flavin-dependent oxidoreductase (luciferase family)